MQAFLLNLIARKRKFYQPLNNNVCIIYISVEHF